jgi:hypothetical protein
MKFAIYASVKKINIKINTYTHKHITRNSEFHAGRGHDETPERSEEKVPSCPHGSPSKLSTTHNSHTLILYSTSRDIAHTHASHSQAHLANPGNDFTFFLSFFTLKKRFVCVCVKKWRVVWRKDCLFIQAFPIQGRRRSGPLVWCLFSLGVQHPFRWGGVGMSWCGMWAITVEAHQEPPDHIIAPRRPRRENDLQLIHTNADTRRGRRGGGGAFSRKLKFFCENRQKLVCVRARQTY